jgi:hypothetical protein
MRSSNGGWLAKRLPPLLEILKAAMAAGAGATFIFCALSRACKAWIMFYLPASFAPPASARNSRHLEKAMSGIIPRKLRTICSIITMK